MSTRKHHAARVTPTLDDATRVLVVEDDQDMRELLAHYLRHLGCEVLEASNGADVVSYYEELRRLRLSEAPHIIVSDVRMPRLNGLAMVTALRAARFHGPIILMTGFGSPELHAQALHLGATAVLDKPLRVPALIALFKQCLLVGVRPHDRRATSLS